MTHPRGGSIMSIQNFVRLPILLTLLLQLSLGPTSSFSLSPRRFWTPLRAAGSAYNNGGDSGGPEGQENAESASSFDPFERIVRRVTGNEQYKFGDISRSVVNSTTHGVEDVVRSVTQDESYQFGDLTRKTIGSTTHSIEGLVKSVTGDEGYQFGDMTRGTMKAAGSVMTYSEKTLGLMRDHNIHEFIELMNFYWTKTMNYEERKEAFTVVIYLGAIAVLSYNFVANVMSGLVFAAAWTKLSLAAGTSPLSPGMWPKFLETKSTLDMFFGGPCVPARAILTIPWFFRYRKFVVSTAFHSPLREKFPIINRYMSLLLSWSIANIAFVGGVTLLMVQMLSLWSGVPVLPVAP